MGATYGDRPDRSSEGHFQGLYYKIFYPVTKTKLSTTIVAPDHNLLRTKLSVGRQLFFILRFKV